MSTERVELRASGIHDVGVKMDDLLEGAQKEILRCEGAALGLLQCNKAVNDLMGHVDSDVNDGKYDHITEALEVAKLVKLYISRAVQIVANLGMNANNQKMIVTGQIQAMQMAVAVTKKMHEAEMAKASAIVEAEQHPEDIDLRGRQAGVRPPISLKERRLAEERVEASVPQLSVVSPTNGKGKRGRRKG